MKFRTTEKYVKEQCVVFSAGYCRVSSLFYDIEPEAFTSCTYGWNADIYTHGGTALVTGYRTFGTPCNDIADEYNNKAKKIILKSDNYKSCHTKLEKLRAKFWQTLMELDKENQ